MVRPPEPDRVDLDEPAEQDEHRRDGEQQAERARRLAREGRHADDRALGLPRRLRGTACGAAARRARGARASSAADQRPAEEHVRDVHPRLERVLAGERPVPDQQPRGSRRRTGSRARPRSRSRGPSPRAGRRRASSRGSPRAARASASSAPIAVGQLARLAVGAGEEDAQQVQDDRGDEDVGRPVVRLPDQQAGLDARTRCRTTER